jgi:DNA-binding Xre family transcriptional regulator
MGSRENDGVLRPWGIALERLREERGMKASELCYRVRMGQPQHHKICTQSKDGPTLDTLGRLLVALECS